MRNVLLAVLLTSACGGGIEPAEGDAQGLPSTEVARVDEAIQGGARDTHDPAVGLVWLLGGGFCSGTLIAPDVVLTAGHCVEEPVTAFYTGTGQGTGYVGPVPAAGLVGHAVIDQIAHPSYQSIEACPNPTFDVALLRLARPLAGIAPLAVASHPPAPGSTCRTVGYGIHDAASGIETVEQRRSATEKVLAVSQTAVHVQRKSGIVDHGDSGGPLLCAGEIAGVTSCATDGGGPRHREAYYGRTDDVASWIAHTVAAWR
jgi:hypothetical protein